MSQAGSIDLDGGVLPPEVPTEFVADVGSAVPVANVLEIFGDTQAAGNTPVHTTGSGNTITTIVQTSQALGATDATAIGLAAFDSASFAVDANGFVTFSGTFSGVDSINVDASSPPGTDPVLPDGAGLVTMTGRQVPSLAVGAQVIRSNSIAVNSLTYEIQQAGANAVESTNYNGVCHFDSSQFTVSNGFVTLIGGSLAIDSVAVQTGTSPVVPTAAGLLTINGAVVAAGTNPVRSDGTGANTLAIEVQISQALAATDATKIGLCNFKSTDFAVDANGFVSASTTGIGKTITGNTGGALSPTANNWNIIAATVAAGTSPITTAGAVSTLTINAQISQALAATDATKIGLSNFNSAHFSVDANGFVALAGGGVAIDSIDVQATSGAGTDPVLPTAAGLVTFEGALIAAGTNPLRAVSTAANTVQMQVQTSQALAATDATKVGLCNFSSADFTVDANGFVALTASAGGDVSGPGASTDNALVRWDGATGTLIQNGVVIEDDTGNISQSASVSGASLSIQTLNTSNTASSTAYHQCQVAGATASDAYYIANISGGQAWSWGLDNSDGDAWVLSATATPGTTNVMRVSTAGEINYPLQPAFLATSGDHANVTGDATSYKIVYDGAEVYDQGGDFDGVSTFTMPITGKVHLCATTSLEGILSTHTSISYRIVTSNLSYNNYGGAPSKIFDVNTRAGWIVSTDADMDAADIADVRVTVSSGTKVIDIQGAGSGLTYFSGRMVC